MKKKDKILILIRPLMCFLRMQCARGERVCVCVCKHIRLVFAFGLHSVCMDECRTGCCSHARMRVNACCSWPNNNQVQLYVFRYDVTIVNLLHATIITNTHARICFCHFPDFNIFAKTCGAAVLLLVVLLLLLLLVLLTVSHTMPGLSSLLRPLSQLLKCVPFHRIAPFPLCQRCSPYGIRLESMCMAPDW